jgi:hypothetical protein
LTTSLSLARHPLASIEAAFLPKLQEMAQQIGRGLAD